MSEPLVRIEDLTVRFATRERVVHAVNGVSLALGERETLGILGESGSGKSVTLRALLRLLPRKRAQIAGRIVESGATRDVVRTPRHPYTAGLLRSRAHGALKGQRLEAIPGAPPDLARLPEGCAFAPRCRLAIDACTSAVPEPRAVGPGHTARCVRADEEISAA